MNSELPYAAPFKSSSRATLLRWLGWTFPIAAIFTVPVGLTLKVPEILLMVLIAFDLTNRDFQCRRSPIPHMVSALLFLSLLVFPIISNIAGMLEVDLLVQGANMMGMVQVGRFDPYTVSWVMLGWNIYCILILFSFAKSTQIEVEAFLKALFYSALITNCFGIFEAIYINRLGIQIPWPTDVRHDVDFQVRARAFFQEPLNFGHFLISSTGFIYLWPNLPERLGISKSVARIGFIVSTIAFFLTFAVSAFLAAIVGIVSAFFLSQKTTKKDILILVGLIILVFASVLAIPLAKAAFIDKVIASIYSPDVVGDTILSRVWKIEAGLNAFLDRPFVGTGLGTSGFLYPLYSPNNASISSRL